MQLFGIIVLIVAGVGLLGGLVWVGQRSNSGADPLMQRLASIADREVAPSLSDLEMSLSFRERVALPMLKALSRIVTTFTPEQQLEQISHQLELAGKSQTMDARMFFAQRILMMVALAAGAFIVFFVVSKNPNALLFIVGAAALGYFLPALQLKSQISRRQNGITKALPDALDLMTICVEAGLGFDAAMGKVYEKWDNDLALAFGRIIQEIQLGKARRDALRDMSNRMDVPDVKSFTAAIIQADQLGVSISKILRIQADQMRVKRRQRAEEKAHQAPVKMLIPMVFLIFPSIWIVLLGPSIIVLMHTNPI